MYLHLLLVLASILSNLGFQAWDISCVRNMTGEHWGGAFSERGTSRSTSFCVQLRVSLRTSIGLPLSALIKEKTRCSYIFALFAGVAQMLLCTSPPPHHVAPTRRLRANREFAIAKLRIFNRKRIILAHPESFSEYHHGPSASCSRPASNIRSLPM